jgi:hypothetical protein
MQELFKPQTYRGIMMVLWMIPIPLILRDSVGDGTNLVAGIVAVATGLVIGRTTAASSNMAKLAALLLSGVVIGTMGMLFSK